MPTELPGVVDAVTFDCYGTLIDWERGILGALRSVIPLDCASDDAVLHAYAAAEATLEAGGYRPYREVLWAVEAEVLRSFAVGEPATGRLAESLPRWPPFADTVGAIRALRSRCRVGVISNIDEDLFALHMRGVGIEVDFVVTAEACGSYKPSSVNFERARVLHGLGEGWVHAAESLYHDVEPCNRLGIPCVWVHRRHAQVGFGATAEAAAIPSARVTSVGELVELLLPRFVGLRGA